MSDAIDPELSALLHEDRVFQPPASSTPTPSSTTRRVYEEAERDPEAFWAKFASELEWSRRWTRVLDWSDPPHAKWFVGGQLNVSVNCVDRHVRTARRNKAAIIWEGEPGDRRTLTYFDLYRQVSAFANVLKSLGVKKGDRVAIYMPLVPELAIAMLACARIGAPHSIVFGGFSAESLRDRMNDAQCKVLVTADGGYRRGSVVPLLKVANEAIEGTPSLEHMIVFRRMAGRRCWGLIRPRARSQKPKAGVRQHDWHELMAKAPLECPAEPMDSEDLLYILYTSGTTGKPKGIMHTTGGYLTGVYATTKWVFDLKDDDVYWCTADIGWVTGHSYVVYGPLANGATVVMYEGAPDFPQKDRLVGNRRAIRRDDFLHRADGNSRVHEVGTGLAETAQHVEPAAAWIGRRAHQSRGVDLVSQIHRRRAMPDRRYVVADRDGHDHDHAAAGHHAAETRVRQRYRSPASKRRFAISRVHAVEVGGGFLALTRPWPAMLRGIYGDPERFVTQYWSKWDRATYFTGDGAKRDEDGYYWVLGRVDDVINVAGHRIGTMEVESALVDHPKVAEAAVVGRLHDMKGQAISAFVILKEGNAASPALVAELKEHVVKKIGSIARPEDILFVADVPKTRSGKIMRRLLKDIAEGKALGDTTTLADPAVVAKLKADYEEAG